METTKEQIEVKLTEIGDYFKHKIISGDFKFISCDEYTAKVIIDERHDFQLWISNDPKEHFNFYSSSFLLDKAIDYLRFTTEKQRLAGWRKIKPHVKNYRKTILKKEKQKEIDRLKKEISKLK